MSKPHHNNKHRGSYRVSRAGGHFPRSVTISKSLSRLLRHAAVQEGVPIDSHGYVRVDHVLNWQRLRAMQPRVEMAELVEVVRGNDKGRFGLVYRGMGDGDDRGRIAEEGIGEIPKAEDGGGEEESVQNETQRAIAVYESGADVDERHYFIRANQGHSMKGVEAENLLTPITLEDPESVPATVVHGTFYGAWEAILRDSAVKRRGRNHVHFSTGPSLQTVLEAVGDGERVGQNERGRLSRLMEESKVVSGMRKDAEVLIYVDVQKSLQEGGMKWWRSENGVVLTEGLGDDGKVDSAWWDKVVEVKEGLGSLWSEGQVLKDLPAHLKGRALPMGKGRGGGNVGRSRGGGNGGRKPKLRVESDDFNGP